MTALDLSSPSKPSVPVAAAASPEERALAGPTFGGTGCNPRDPAHQLLWGHFLPDEPPEQATPHPGRDALQRAVEVAEAELSTITDQSLEQSHSPDALVASAATRVASALATADGALEHARFEPAELQPLVQRLDLAIGGLYVLSRRHRIPMRETHLEEVFDREDKIRKSYSPYGPTNRADAYYDTDLIPITHTTQPAPDALQLTAELESGMGGGPPRNRDELVQEIVGFGTGLANAMSGTVDNAGRIIEEPSRPKHPSIVDALVEAAINVLAGGFNAALGKVIGAGLDFVKLRTGVEDLVGKQLTDVAHEAFRIAGKDNAKLLGRTALGEHEAPVSDSALSPKTRYLMMATDRVTATTTSIAAGFMRHAGTLRRVPTDTLLALAAALNSTAVNSLCQTLHELVINQWLTFGKELAEHGEDVRDPAKRPAHPSKLDNMFAPYGVVCIRVRLDAASAPQLETAKLQGVSDAVLVQVRKERSSLGGLGLHRRVELAAPNPETPPPGGFELDPSGRVTFDPSAVGAAGRRLWAGLAGRQAGDSLSDSDVISGVNVLVRWLDTMGPEVIEGGDV